MVSAEQGPSEALLLETLDQMNVAFSDLVKAQKQAILDKQQQTTTGGGEGERQMKMERFKASCAQLTQILDQLDERESELERGLSAEARSMAEKLRGKQELVNRARASIGKWDKTLETLIADKETILQQVME